MSVQILGVDLYHILSWFIIYSFLGWIWESSYVSIKHGKWMNRGFVNGPFLTIYGTGAVVVYVILRPLTGHVIELYFGGVAVATILEYVTGVLMETIFHANWWDYSKKKFNFQGKICLGSSVAWGFFTLGLFYVLQPRVASVVDMVPRNVGYVCVYIWLAGYLVDFSFSVAAALDLRNRMKELDVLWDEFQKQMEGTKLHAITEELRAKASVYNLTKSEAQWKEHIAARKEKFVEVLDRLIETDSGTGKEILLQKYEDFVGRYSSVKAGLGRISHRYLTVYPNLIGKTERIRRSRRNRKAEQHTEKRDQVRM